MMHGNERWGEFHKALFARGVTMSWLWEARRDGAKPQWPKKPADVGMVAFTGSGFQPSVLVAVVIDYGGKNGFGLFTDDSALMSDDVDRICKPRSLQLVTDKAPG